MAEKDKPYGQAEFAQEQARRLTLLNEMSMALNQATTLDDVFWIATRKTKQIIKTDRASIALLNPDKTSFKVFVLDDKSGAIPQDAELMVDEASGIGQAIKTKQVILSLNIQNNQAPENIEMAKHGFQTAIVAPLIASGRVMGTLNVASKTLDSYDKQDKNLMSQVASFLGIAIQNQELREQSRKYALELEETNNFLDSVIENLPVMLFVKEAQDLRFVRLNKAGEELTGYSREEFLGKTDHDFFPKEEADIFVAKDREVLSNGKLLDIPKEPIHTAQQETRWLYTRKVPIYDSAGKPKYLLGMSEDITKRIVTEQILTKQATQLGIVTQVSAAASTILETSKLLQTVVDLTKSSFSYYHAHIYVFNAITNALDLVAGADQIGRELVKQGWHIPFNQEQSLVAKAARSRQGVIVPDVWQDAGFFKNPMLPNTRSELAIPIIAGDELMGVLDIQSDKVDVFTADDVRIQTTLTTQIANAMRNARLFETAAMTQMESDSRLQETLALQKFSWDLAGTLQVDDMLKMFFEICIREIGFEYVQFSLVDKRRNRIKAVDGSGVSASNIKRANHSLDSDDIMAYIIKTGETEVITGWDDRFDRENWETEGHANWVRIFTPVVLGQENIGLVEAGFNKQLKANISNAQLRLLQSFISQTSLALESARRYEASQKAALHLTHLNEFATALGQADTVADVLKVVPQGIANLIKTHWVSLALLTDIANQLEIFVLQGQSGLAPLTTRLPMDGTFSGWAIREKHIVTALNEECHNFIEVKELTQQGLQSMMSIPLMVRGKAIGSLNIASKDSDAFTDDDESLLLQMASLLATTIESRRLLTEAHTRVRREQQLREITARIRSAADVDSVMRIAAHEVGRVLNRQTFVYLDTEDSE